MVPSTLGDMEDCNLARGMQKCISMKGSPRPLVSVTCDVTEKKFEGDILEIDRVNKVNRFILAVGLVK